MSPEQASGERELDGRSDIYSLGVLGYRMLTGRVPFEGNVQELIAQHVSKAPTPLSVLDADLPQALVHAVHRAMEKEPARRWADARELVGVLREEEAGLEAQPFWYRALRGYAMRKLLACAVWFNASLVSIALPGHFSWTNPVMLLLLPLVIPKGVILSAWRARANRMPGMRCGAADLRAAALVAVLVAAALEAEGRRLGASPVSCASRAPLGCHHCRIVGRHGAVPDRRECR